MIENVNLNMENKGKGEICSREILLYARYEFLKDVSALSTSDNGFLQSGYVSQATAPLILPIWKRTNPRVLKERPKK